MAMAPLSRSATYCPQWKKGPWNLASISRSSRRAWVWLTKSSTIGARSSSVIFDDVVIVDTIAVTLLGLPKPFSPEQTLDVSLRTPIFSSLPSVQSERKNKDPRCITRNKKPLADCKRSKDVLYCGCQAAAIGLMFAARRCSRLAAFYVSPLLYCEKNIWAH